MTPGRGFGVGDDAIDQDGIEKLAFVKGHRGKVGVKDASLFALLLLGVLSGFS